MQVQIDLTTQPIVWADRIPRDLADRAGARTEFQGIVRGEEAGRRIAALDYEAYSPMAERVMRRIVEDIGHRHACLSVRVTHRVGIVPAGEAAILVAVAATHRSEAFALVTQFMDRLKQEVPIWKRRALDGEELEALRP